MDGCSKLDQRLRSAVMPSYHDLPPKSPQDPPARASGRGNYGMSGVSSAGINVVPYNKEDRGSLSTSGLTSPYLDSRLNPYLVRLNTAGVRHFNKANGVCPSLPQRRYSATESGSAVKEDGTVDLLRSMASKLAAAEGEIQRKEKKIHELNESLQRSKEMSKEVISARRAAKEAVEDMAEQNAKLIQAYLEKKKEIKEVRQGAKDCGSALDKELASVKQENAQLKESNQWLQEQLMDLRAEMRSLKQSQAQASIDSEQRPPAPGFSTSSSASAHGNAMHSLTPNTLSIASLQDHNNRLARENAALRAEQEAILSRAVQRDKVDHHKQMGNVAFQQQNYKDALQHYSAAISVGLGEDHLNAILYCNRAACNFNLSNYMDCIYDCTIATSLEPTYQRAYQRRADAYTALQRYSDAAKDTAEMSEMTARIDLQHAAHVLQERSKCSIPDHYAVLGVSSEATEAEIRSAYKQLALKYHPDKSGSNTEKLAAEAVFRLLSDASQVLCNTTARAEYNQQRCKTQSQ